MIARIGHCTCILVLHVLQTTDSEKRYKQSDQFPHSPPAGRTFTFSPVKPKYDALYHDSISSSLYGPNTCPSVPVEPGTFHLYSYLTSADGGTHEGSTLPARLTERTSSS